MKNNPIKSMKDTLESPRENNTLRTLFRESNLISYLVILFMVAFIIFPLFWMVSTSLKLPNELTAFPPQLVPDNPSLQPAVNAWNTAEWGRWFINTFIFATGATVGTLLICVPAAYALARKKFVGRTTLYLIIMGFLVFPAQVLLVPMYLLFIRAGLTNSYIGLIIAYSALHTGFTTFLLWGFFRSLPSNVEEAARVAGIPEWKTFLRIILPLMKPGIGVASVFLFVFTWNEYLWALVFLSDRSMYTISIGLPVFQGLHGSVAMNQLMAMATLACIPVIILFALTQEEFMKGVTTGYEF